MTHDWLRTDFQERRIPLPLHSALQSPGDCVRMDFLRAMGNLAPGCEVTLMRFGTNDGSRATVAHGFRDFRCELDQHEPHHCAAR